MSNAGGSPALVVLLHFAPWPEVAMMTEHEAVDAAVDYMAGHGFSPNRFKVKAEFSAKDSLYNQVLHSFDDEWIVSFEPINSKETDPTSVLRVNCRSGVVTPVPVL
jgi:hypothetical protein